MWKVLDLIQFGGPSEILFPHRQSAELAAARRNNPAAVGAIPVEYVDDKTDFNPEWIVDRISSRPILLITSDNDRLVLKEEAEQLYAHAKEPKKGVVFQGVGHYEVYAELASTQVMTETLAWFQEHVPAK